MVKLSLTMICKDELENLKRLQPLVKDHIDEWVVVLPPNDPAERWAKKNGLKVVVEDFTQGVEPEILRQFGEYGLDVDKDYRLFNFAAARNEGLRHATGDFVLWLDADDEPVGIENLRGYIEANPKTDVFYAIYDYFRDEEGNRASDHTRERVIRNSGDFTWLGSKLGLIHETLIARPGSSPLDLTIPDNVFVVRHHTDHIVESSRRNHIALLYEYLKTNGEDPRNTYYLGIEFFNRGMYELCIKTLLEFVKHSGSVEDRYQAWVKVAEAYHLLGMAESGRNAYYAAIDEMPNYPHAFLGLGESYFAEENWAKCIDFTLTGLQKKMPGTRHGLDKTRFTFRPAGYVALSYLQLGKPLDAYEWYVRAAKMNPKHPWVNDYLPLFREVKDLDDYVKAFVKLGQISQRLYPRTLSKLADVVPDELMDQEVLMDFRWRYTRPKIWSKNSVVFFCSAAFEDWGPDSLKKGCGGSEEAIIQLTKELVKLGWDVTVYNNCPKEGMFDGVKWVRFERFNPRDIFNVLVGWRNNPFLDPKVASKKFLDMHDVPNKPIEVFYPEKEGKDVTILVKSQYHRSLFTHLPDDNFVVIPNGIDPEQFKNPGKVKNNLVWTSSYDRGLENLLEMWSDVRKDVPDATLDVYYGFALYDTTPWGRTQKGQRWKAKMLALLDQEGVTDHGRVGSDEVAEAYKKADVFAYPSDFPEIDMISLTKAMAAKCVPVATQTGAVKERNQGVVVEGNINDPATKEAFKKHLIELLKDDERKESIRSWLDVSDCSWEAVAKQWDKLFR